MDWMKTAYNAYRCLAKDLDAYAMNPEMTMDIGSLSHEQDLMSSHSPHHNRNPGASLRIHQDLTVASSRLRDGLQHGFDSGRRRRRRRRRVPSRAFAAAPSRHEHALRHLPIRDERHLHHPHPSTAPCRQFPPCPTNSTIRTITTITTSVSLGTWAAASPSCGTRGLYQPWTNLYNPYHKDMSGMGQSLSPLGNGLGSIHNAQQTLHNYGAHSHDKMLSSNFDAHTAMLARSDQHLSRGLGGPAAGMIPPHLNGMLGHPGHPQSHGPVLASNRDRPLSSSSSSGAPGSGSGQLEEINTKEVAQRITAELKRYSIPQAIFAQRVLCRSQGTLSDLLRNPKPWSKLKSGRETFRRMWKWLQEPEFQRMSALRLAGKTRYLLLNISCGDL